MKYIKPLVLLAAATLYISGCCNKHKEENINLKFQLQQEKAAHAICRSDNARLLDKTASDSAVFSSAYRNIDSANKKLSSRVYILKAKKEADYTPKTDTADYQKPDSGLAKKVEERKQQTEDIRNAKSQLEEALNNRQKQLEELNKSAKEAAEKVQELLELERQ